MKNIRNIIRRDQGVNFNLKSSLFLFIVLAVGHACSQPEPSQPPNLSKDTSKLSRKSEDQDLASEDKVVSSKSGSSGSASTPSLPPVGSGAGGTTTSGGSGTSSLTPGPSTPIPSSPTTNAPANPSPAPGNGGTVPQIFPGIPAILGVSGPTLEQCNGQGQSWTPRLTGFNGAYVSGACGNQLVNWCCTEQNILQKFPDSASSLSSTFANLKSQGMRLYNCSDDGQGKYSFLFFVVNQTGAHVSSAYVTNSVPVNSPQQPAPQSCPRVSSAELGLP